MKRCVSCGKVPTRGEFLYLKPDGSEAWLCGKAKCEREYQGE